MKNTKRTQTQIQTKTQKILVILNHEMTQEQFRELQSYGIQEIVQASDETKKLWSQIPTNKDLVFKQYLKSVKAEILDKQITHLFVQGEATATTYLVSWAYKKRIKSYAAMSVRESNEVVMVDGTTKTAIFKHLGFRKYQMG